MSTNNHIARCMQYGRNLQLKNIAWPVLLLSYMCISYFILITILLNLLTLERIFKTIFTLLNLVMKLQEPIIMSKNVDSDPFVIKQLG